MSAKKSILFVAAVVVILGLAAQAQAWTPAGVSGLQSWIDPTDGSKVTTTSGYVSNVLDSWNGKNFTPTNGTGQVTYNLSAFGSLAGLQFTGSGQNLSHSPSSDVLNLPYASPSTAQWACFAVINIPTSPATNHDYTIESNFVSTPLSQQMFQVYRWDGNASHQYGTLAFYPGSGGWITSPSNAVTFGVPHIVEFEYTGGATPTMQMYVDGASQTLSGTIPNLTLNSGQVFYLGSQGGNSNIFQGLMGDVLNFNSVLSSTDRNYVGYNLAQEFGVTGSTYVGTPEPSTLVLLAAGLAGLLCYAWRKRR